MVSPGSQMLQMNLPEEELEALVTFTMGLAKPDISYDYIGVEALQEFRGIVVVVSHDHRFLDNVCTHILDADYQTAAQFAMQGRSMFLELKYRRP